MCDERLIDKVYSIILMDRLTGRCMDDTCTDGYETHLVLLAKQIVDSLLGERVNSKKKEE